MKSRRRSAWAMLWLVAAAVLIVGCRSNDPAPNADQPPTERAGPTAAPTQTPTVAGPSEIPATELPATDVIPLTDSTYADRAQLTQIGGDTFAATFDEVLVSSDRGLTWRSLAVEMRGVCLSVIDGMPAVSSFQSFPEDADRSWEFQVWQGAGWQKHLVPVPPDVPIRHGRPCRIASAGGVWIVAAAGWDGAGPSDGKRVIWAMVSSDDGATWRAVHLSGQTETDFFDMPAFVDVAITGDDVFFEASYSSNSIGGAFTVVVPLDTLLDRATEDVEAVWWEPLLGPKRGHRYIAMVGDQAWATDVLIDADAGFDHELTCGAAGRVQAGPHPDGLRELPVTGVCPQLLDLGGTPLVHVRASYDGSGEESWWVPRGEAWTRLDESPVVEWHTLAPDVGPVAFFGVTGEGRVLVIPHGVAAG